MKTGSDRTVSHKTCDICGGDAGPILGPRHCRTRECSLAYLAREIEKRIEVRGECRVWLGSLRKGDVPYVSMAHDYPSDRRKDYRVLDALAIIDGEDPELASCRNYKNLCGTRGCVVREHYRLERAAISLFISAKLPVTPLAEYVERRQTRLPKKLSEALRRAKHAGTLTVSCADEICIDGLGCHPADIYGEEFFTAC